MYTIYFVLNTTVQQGILTIYFAFVVQSALLYNKSWSQCKRTGPAGLGRTIEDEDTVRSPIAALPIDPRKL